MSSVVLDSSAVLAYLQNESGGLLVEQFLPVAVVSTVNLAEIVTKLVSCGGGPDAVKQDVADTGIAVADFTRELAEDTGALIRHTADYGLSLGDRACLALARREHLPVLTADRAWKDLQIGVDVRLIR